jgi:hypothetical protein
MARLGEENALLLTRLSAASPPASAPPKRVVRTALEKRPIDWAEVARELAESSAAGGSNVYLTNRLHLDEAFRLMSREELITGLDEVALAGLNQRQRESLESALYAQLQEKDPEYALTRSLDRDEYSSYRTYMLGNWAAKDLPKAVAWLDQQIAAGKLADTTLTDGMHQRIAFERELIYPLIAADPLAAGRRMAALPQNKRIAVLQTYHLAIAAEDQGDFAQLIRDQLEGAQRLGAITWPVTSKGEGGTTPYAEVDAYFQNITATPEERRACILSLASTGRFPRESGRFFNTSAGDLDALRAWVGKTEPALADQAAAGGVKSLLGSLEYPKVAEMAVHCHDAGAGDEVLLPLLDYNVEEHPELARSLAAKIRDPRRRAEILTKLEETLER